MQPQDALVERFEKTIDMPAYLSSRGFVASHAEPRADHLAMTGPKGEVLRLQKDLDRGGWTYANASVAADRGSLVSFLERHEGLDRKAALEMLIACADERRRDVGVATAYRNHLRDKPEGLRRAEASYLEGAARRQEANRMLQRLGVAAASFDSWRFGAVRGAEDVTQLLAEPAAGTLSPSRYRPTDRKLVLVERPIDAIAYEARHGRQEACYIATGSNLDPDRKRRLAHLLAEARGVDVVLAFGRHRAGEDLAAQVQALAPMLRIERRGPEVGGRWADQMQLEGRHARSLGRLAHGRHPGAARGLG